MTARKGSNGAAESAADLTDKATLADLVAGAAALPNIDGRPSVLLEIPADLLVDGRAEFAIASQQKLGALRFGSPNDQQWVRCRPEPEWSWRIQCLKDKNGAGKLYPIGAGLLQQHPKLALQAKLYEIRLAVDSESNYLLWPSPRPGKREAPSDSDHRLAVQHSLARWTRFWWDGFHCYHEAPEENASFGQPVWPEEPPEQVLMKGIGEIIITDIEQSPLALRILGRSR